MKGHDPDYRMLVLIFERLGVRHAEEISLEEQRPGALGDVVYIARSPSMTTHIDRPLAVQLRADGARWCGSISRDPCAVA